MKKLRPISTITENADLIKERPADLELAKSIVCPFYQEGEDEWAGVSGGGGCSGCLQEEDTVKACKKHFLARIYVNTQDNYTNTFDTPLPRDKVQATALKETVLGISCDNCYAYDKCPLYKEAHQCSIEWGLEISDLTEDKQISYLIDLQSERVNRGRAFERLDGGMLDQLQSNEIDRLSALIAMKKDLSQSKFSLKIEASQRGDAGGEGIMSKIFGGGNNTPAVEAPKTIAIDEGTKKVTVEDIAYTEMPPEPKPEPVEEVKPKKKQRPLE